MMYTRVLYLNARGGAGGAALDIASSSSYSHSYRAVAVLVYFIRFIKRNRVNFENNDCNDILYV